MRLLKSLGSAIAALTVSGIYGVLLTFITWKILNWLVSVSPTRLLSPTSEFIVMGSLTLMQLHLEIGGAIWGCTVAFAKEKQDIFLGVFLAVLLPALLLQYLSVNEFILFWWEPQPISKETLIVSTTIGSFFLLCFLTFLWIKSGKTVWRLPFQRTLQDFADTSTLGRSSRGVRLLTLAIFAQMLVLTVGWFLCRH